VGILIKSSFDFDGLGQIVALFSTQLKPFESCDLLTK
jgi:hypothetical protein